MVSQPLGGIIAGLASLGVGAASVAVVSSSDGGADSHGAKEETVDADPVETRIKELSDLRHECATRVGASCNALGSEYETRKDLWGGQIKGAGLHRDDAKALLYFRLACDYSDGSGCYNLARMYDTGKGVARDAAEAESAYTKACALIGGEACSHLDKPPLPVAPKLRF